MFPARRRMPIVVSVMVADTVDPLGRAGWQGRVARVKGSSAKVPEKTVRTGARRGLLDVVRLRRLRADRGCGVTYAPGYPGHSELATSNWSTKRRLVCRSELMCRASQQGRGIVNISDQHYR